MTESPAHAYTELRDVTVITNDPAKASDVTSLNTRWLPIQVRNGKFLVGLRGRVNWTECRLFGKVRRNLGLQDAC